MAQLYDADVSWFSQLLLKAMVCPKLEETGSEERDNLATVRVPASRHQLIEYATPVPQSSVFWQQGHLAKGTSGPKVGCGALDSSSGPDMNTLEFLVVC
ncbi:hypothetical protein P7K49_033897 [Saguinus oedipus]|uniref:Uncharacterized protein n=1 Tax=Saguinus oedipus TaxID=9490 RepID=A0ABQ9TU27_SAGOE|nr:hypothetical protein P7K49_033897 [Saguinus oedipus]